MIITRVACVLIPGFATDLYVRSDPKLIGKPLAVAEHDGETALIVAVNEAARAEGVSEPMTAAQGLACCRELVVIPRHLEREMTVSNTIYKLLQSISPYVEETALGLFCLDVSGFGLLYRTEEDLARGIMAALQPSAYQAQLGIASHRFVAHTAARRTAPGAWLIIPNGGERKFLAPLAVEYLPLTEASRSILEDLGITTLGQLARISSHDLTDRLGPDGNLLARLVRGEDGALFVSGPPKDQFSDTITFTFPLLTAEAIVTHTEPLLSGLLAQLGQFSRGCCCVNLLLSLDDRSEMELRLAIDRPALSPRKFLRQLSLLLSRQQLTAGITGIRVVIPAVTDLAPEQGILVTSEQEPAASMSDLDWSRFPSGVTIARPCVSAGLIPEQRITLQPFSAKEGKADSATSSVPLYAVHSISGLRLLQPAERVDVSTAQRQVTGITRRGKSLAVTHTDGPWRLTGGWWDQAYHRLYYEIETDDRSRYLLYFDRAGSRWLLQGIFD